MVAAHSNQATSKIVLLKPLILLPEGFYCEAAAGSAEDAFADKAETRSGSEASNALICWMNVGVRKRSQNDFLLTL